MTAELRAFFNSFGTLAPATLAEVVGRFERRRGRRGEVLLRPGNVCDELLFVRSGCLRTSYAGLDGQDISM